MNISQVSKKYNLTADTLRYYEKVGLLPHVQREPNGIRNYSDIDCNWIEFIKCMRNAGIPIETLAKYVSLFYKGNKTLLARKNLLIRERDALKKRIEEGTAVLERLNKKIALYDENIRDWESKLK